MKLRPHQWRYSFTAYRALPITFVRRVFLGRDPYWRQYFWSRWGYVPRKVMTAARGRRVLWIDAFSGGEVTQIVTFCRKLREALPGWILVLSTNNRYSFDFARANLAVDFVIDAPWDCRGPVRRALNRIDPIALICVQNVTCPVLAREAKRRGVTTIVVSGLMSRDVHLHPMFWRTMEWNPFGHLDWIGAWSEEDVRGFVAQGANPERVVVTGNMKFDLDYLHISDEERNRLRAALQLSPQEPVFLAASLHPGEEELIGEAYLQARQTVTGLRLVLVPRYQFHIDEMVERLRVLGLSCARKTSLASQPVDGQQVVVVDTFGELNCLYAVASVIFLGGSTYRRNVLGLGQNPVEPLVHKRPLFFGPFMNLWREITEELKTVWAGVEIATSKELAAGVIAALEDSLLASQLGEKVEQLLAPHREDVGKTVDLVLSKLSAGLPNGEGLRERRSRE